MCSLRRARRCVSGCSCLLPELCVAKRVPWSPAWWFSIPEYESLARARMLHEIADAPSTAELLASKGDRLLERHPLMPEDTRIMRCMMCDCFHQGAASEHHKTWMCSQHDFRMCPAFRDIPTTFMESINKVDRLHLRSICVQDPGKPQHSTEWCSLTRAARSLIGACSVSVSARVCVLLLCGQSITFFTCAR